MWRRVGVFTTRDARGNVCRRFGELQGEHRCGSTEEDGDNDEERTRRMCLRRRITCRRRRRRRRRTRREEGQLAGRMPTGASSNAVDERWF
jgi:hypothetical protein